MTFSKLEALARNMDAEQCQATLKQLCDDPRLAAVLKLIRDEKEIVSDTMTDKGIVERPQLLARAAGGRFLCMELEAKLRAVCTPEKPKRKPSARQADESQI